MNWSAAKLALVATSRVGVGPGVKMLFQRSSKKVAIITQDIARFSTSQVDRQAVSKCGSD